jgi:ubiquinone biosynthesis protein
MMKDLLHLIKLVNIILKARLDTLLSDYSESRTISFLLFISPWRLFSSQSPRGERIKKALEEAGPIFIKFGQLISTRPDVVPTDIARALQSLQDNLPPFSSDEALRIIEKDLGNSVDYIFDDFERTPFAAASIAQVYSAKLKGTQDEVAIKVVRPNIAIQISKDLSLMKRIAKLAEYYSSDAKRLRLLKLVEEYEYVIKAELDMRIEASNINQTRRNFEGNELLYVPIVYWDLSSKRVLVMEKISGVPVDKIDVLKDLGVDFKMLSERGGEIFL